MLSNTFKKTIENSLDTVKFKSTREEFVALNASIKLFNARLKQVKQGILGDLQDHQEDFYVVESHVKEHIVKAHNRIVLRLTDK